MQFYVILGFFFVICLWIELFMSSLIDNIKINKENEELG